MSSCGRCASRGEVCTFSEHTSLKLPREPDADVQGARKRMGRPRTVNAASRITASPSPSCDLLGPGPYQIESFNALLLTPAMTPQPDFDILSHLNDDLLGWNPPQDTPEYRSTTPAPTMRDTPLTVTGTLGLGFDWQPHPANSGDYDFDRPISPVPTRVDSEHSWADDGTISVRAITSNGSIAATCPTTATSSQCTTPPLQAPEGGNLGGVNQGMVKISTEPSTAFMHGSESSACPIFFQSQQQQQEYAIDCFCHSSAAIQQLRATLRTLTPRLTQQGLEDGESRCALEVALEAAHAVSRRCASSLSCKSCASDPSTPIAVFSTVSLATQILKMAVPSGDELDTRSPFHVAIGSFRPSAAISRRLVLMAFEGEVKELLHWSLQLFVHCGNSGDVDNDDTMCDKVSRQLKEIERRVSALRGELGS